MTSSPIDVFVAGVAEGAYPGGQLAASREGVRLASVSAGRLGPGLSTTDETVLYDLASLTKPLATATLLGRAIERREILLQDPVARLVPEVDPRITLEQLLDHSSGYPAHARFDQRLPEAIAPGTDEAYAHIVHAAVTTALDRAPGSHAVYSDIGYIILGAIVEGLAQASIASALRTAFDVPFFLDRRGLGRVALNADGSRPRQSRAGGWKAGTSEDVASKAGASKAGRARSGGGEERCDQESSVPETSEGGDRDRRFAPTEGSMPGLVHDENCRAMGGAAGHAGLFGTAEDVLSVAEAWIRAYHGEETQVLTRSVARRFWAPSHVPGSTRTLGWDRPSSTNSSTGGRWPPNSVGHLGFTGTSLWIEPERALAVVLITNRVCPTRENERIRTLRPRLYDAAWTAWATPRYRTSPA